MKAEVRVLGVDDAPFDFEDGSVPVVGALMRGRSYLEAVLRTDVEVDGRDATDRIAAMVEDSRYRDQVRVVLLDGISVGGFNVVDVVRLHGRLDRPVVTVTRDEPDLPAMREALQARFEDWEARWDLVRQGELFVVPTEHAPLHVKAIGIDRGEATRLIETTTVRGAIPEPIRVAHLIAAAIVRGESYGRA